MAANSISFDIRALDGKTAFSLSASPETDVLAVRTEAAERMNVNDVSRLILVHDGIKMTDGKVLGDFDVRNNSTISVVLRALPKSASNATATSANAGQASAPSQDSWEHVETTPQIERVNELSVSGHEAKCAVIVQDVPMVEPDATQSALHDTLNYYGRIDKVIIQRLSDEDTESTEKQQAVVVFANEAAARAASNPAASLSILGEPVKISRATQAAIQRDFHVPEGDHPSNEESSTERDDENVSAGTQIETPRTNQATRLIAKVLARGYANGTKGFAYVAYTSQRTGLSAQLSKAARSVRQFDEEKGISRSVQSQMQNLQQRAKDFDEQHNISGRARDTAQSAYQSASAALNDLRIRAERNPQLAQAFKRAQDIYSSASDQVAATWSQTREEIARRSANTNNNSNSEQVQGGETSPLISSRSSHSIKSPQATARPSPLHGST